MAAGLALALAPTVYQGFQSVKQRNEAENLRKSNYIPPSLKKNVARARSMANSSVSPAYQRAKEDIRVATADANAIAKRTSKNAGQIMSNLSAADSMAKRRAQELAVQNDQFKMQAEGMLQQSNNAVAQVEQKNEDQYQGAKAALKGASDQNMYNAITNAASVGIEGMGLAKEEAEATGVTNPTYDWNSPTTSQSGPVLKTPTPPIQRGFNQNLRNSKPSWLQIQAMSPETRIKLYKTADINEILKLF